MRNSTRLILIGFVFGLTLAGCGGSQPITLNNASTLQQAAAAATPLPNAELMRRPPNPSFLRPTTSGTGALYLGADNNVDIFLLSGPNGQEIGSISSGISEPWGLNLDGSNSLYVANSGNGTVTVYPNGATTPSITYAHGVPRPLYALPDRNGNVYVSGVDDVPHAGSLFEYGAATGQIIAHRRLGSETDGMAQDAKGHLYVAFRRWKRYGASIAELGPHLKRKRDLNLAVVDPQGLLVDNSGNLVVVESTLDDILVFPPGSTTPSVTINIPNIGHLAQLAFDRAQTTLWVSSESGYVYSMPYPLTAGTIPTEYESVSMTSNGVAIANSP